MYTDPGGPHKIKLPNEPDRMRFMSSELGPVRCGWPTKSSRLCGRWRSASGAATDSLVQALLRLDGPASALEAAGRFFVAEGVMREDEGADR